MSIQERLEDADLLWRYHRREGALLNVLVAVAATARKTFKQTQGDKRQFEAFMDTIHDGTISIEYRREAVDINHLFYKWLRCELIHTGELPPDIRIDDAFSDPNTYSVRAGGAPEYTVLLSPGWYHLLADAVRDAASNTNIAWNTASAA